MKSRHFGGCALLAARVQGRALMQETLQDSHMEGGAK